MKFNKAVH